MGVFTTLRGHHYVPSTRSHHWNRVRCSIGLGTTSLYEATRHYFAYRGPMSRLPIRACVTLAFAGALALVLAAVPSIETVRGAGYRLRADGGRG
jgi:hypothetical protein